MADLEELSDIPTINVSDVVLAQTPNTIIGNAAESGSIRRLQAVVRSLLRHADNALLERIAGDLVGDNPPSGELATPGVQLGLKDDVHQTFTPYKLEISHTCESTGCGLPHCEMCRNNAQKPCAQAVSPRNYVDDVLRAACGAPLQVHVFPTGACSSNPATAREHSVRARRFWLQVSIVRKSDCSDGTWAELDKRALLTFHNAKLAQPARLLAVDARAKRGHDPSRVGFDAADGFVYFPAADGGGALGRPCSVGTPAGVRVPDLVLRTAGAAVVGGKLPELALAIRAVDQNCKPLDDVIAPVFSNHFEVATAKARTIQNVERPFVDTEVSKLCGVGPTTARRLAEQQITTAGQLRALINGKSTTSEALNKLREALNMRAEAFENMVAVAQAALDIDNRVRVYRRAAEVGSRRCVGLVFSCYKAQTRLQQDGVLGYVEYEAGVERFVPLPTLRWHFRAQHTFAMGALLEDARMAWARPDHPGWEVYRPLGCEGAALVFEDGGGSYAAQEPATAARGALAAAPPALDHDGLLRAAVWSEHAPALGGGHCPTAPLPQLSQQALPHHSLPLGHPDLHADLCDGGLPPHCSAPLQPPHRSAPLLPPPPPPPHNDHGVPAPDAHELWPMDAPPAYEWAACSGAVHSSGPDTLSARGGFEAGGITAATNHSTLSMLPCTQGLSLSWCADDGSQSGAAGALQAVECGWGVDAAGECRLCDDDMVDYDALVLGGHDVESPYADEVAKAFGTLDGSFGTEDAAMLDSV